MAVTQQLVRLDASELERCRNDVAMLDALLGIDWIPATDQADLDWSPRLLEALFVDVEGGPKAIRRATEGDETVSPAHPKGPPQYYVDSDVTMLRPSSVAETFGALAAMDVDAAIARARGDGRLVDFEAKSGLVPGSAAPYLRENFTRLIDFYRGAAERGLAVAMWWD